MSDEERPRKQPKLKNANEVKNLASCDGDIGQPTMTGVALPIDQSSTEETSEANGNESGQGRENGAEISREQKEVPLSKHQQKKLRRREQWEAARDFRKTKRKEKTIAKRERKRGERNTGEGRGGGEGEASPTSVGADMSSRQRPSRQQTKLLPVTFVLDCSYDDLMLEKERISLASQITRSYSENNRAPYHGHLVVSSFDKLLKERFDTVLAKTHKNWKNVRFMQEDFVQAAEMANDWMNPQNGAHPQAKANKNKMAGMFTEKADAKPEDGEVIYLSSESPDALTELKPYSTYIIGGLVDKNRHKGICYKRAVEKGVRTAKLPIGDYIKMASRAVLATSHVVEIMVRWLELGDWGEAFMQVIPSRKGGVLKAPAGSSGTTNEEGETTEHDDVHGEDDEREGEGEGEAENEPYTTAGAGEEEPSSNVPEVIQR